MNSRSDPVDRLKANAVEVASTLVIAAGIAALLFGVNNFWIVFVIGFVFIVPIVALAFGDEDERLAWWGDSKESETTGEERITDGTTENRNSESLSIIRERYARGELTDEQFEKKLERLLETETLESVEERRKARKLLNEGET